MAKEFIVAIELGSTQITGIAGKKNSDGSIHVLAVVREDATSCIRKGVVYNVPKTSQCLTNVMKKLKAVLKSDIGQVYVGVGGQSIHSVRNVIVKELPEDTIISQDIINEMMDQNRSMVYPDQEILDAATQEYKVGSQMQLDPAGVQSTHLEGNFLNILCRKSFYRTLNQCFEDAGISIAELYLAPVALADSVLTETEKRTGCMLVDMGADTTTVAVYFRNILRQLTVIPLGGNNITKDITSMQIEDEDAEQLKLKYASAYTDISEISEDKTIRVDNEREISQSDFVFCVEARLQEIIQNAWYQVPENYKGRLLGGIILTGGGANMPNIRKAFTNVTRIDKIRVAAKVKQNVTTDKPDIKLPDCIMNTALGLLAKGDMNCAAAPKTTNQSGMFGTEVPQPEPVVEPTRPKEPGHVLKPEDKARLEQERQRFLKEQEAIEQRLREDLEKKTAERNNKKKGGIFGGIGKSISDFVSTIIKPEEEEEDK